MKQILKKWLVGILAVSVTVWLASNLGLKLKWEPAWVVIFFVPILGIVNAFVGTLLRLFAAPITCVTLGLFGVIINGIVFYIAALITGAELDFWTALFGAVCLGLISGPLNKLLKVEEE